MQHQNRKAMPANKNAMTRYKILDELLSCRYHNYSLDELTEEVNKRLTELYPDTNGVVRRTIEKDITYLEYEGPFLVEIERYKPKGRFFWFAFGIYKPKEPSLWFGA